MRDKKPKTMRLRSEQRKITWEKLRKRLLIVAEDWKLKPIPTIQRVTRVETEMAIRGRV